MQTSVFRRTRKIGIALGAVAAIGLVASLVAGRPGDEPPSVYSYKIVARYDHDPNAFCQGLVFHNGQLYESTGKHGESTVRRVELETGDVIHQHPLQAEYFGEGLAIAKNRLLQLTWKSGVGIIYDINTLQPTGRFRYRSEGWGLTFDGENLVMSDGSDRIQFLNPETFQVVRTIRVSDRGKRVDRLNELEFVKGEIFANVWYADYIARISPKSGRVLGWVDLRGLWKSRRDRDAVLNGIAYDSVNDRLFVTGKNWPELFEIKLEAR